MRTLWLDLPGLTQEQAKFADQCWDLLMAAHEHGAVFAIGHRGKTGDARLILDTLGIRRGVCWLRRENDGHGRPMIGAAIFLEDKYERDRLPLHLLYAVSELLRRSKNLQPDKPVRVMDAARLSHCVYKWPEIAHAVANRFWAPIVAARKAKRAARLNLRNDRRARRKRRAR